MFERFSAFLAALLVGLSGAAFSTSVAAQSCGGVYAVERGDSLSAIADELYKDAGKWSAVYQANISTIGSDPQRITVGMTLNLTCIDGLPVGLEGGLDVEQVTSVSAPLQIPLGNASVRDKINLLTADDYKPFTDRSLPGGGMYTEIVQKTMEAAGPDKGFAIHWVNDWSSHHEPLLSNALLDLGFPWFKPDCEADPATYRCANLVFSDPVFEVLTLMFVNTANPVAFTQEEDILGKTVCRPAGYSTFIFDHEGRNWLADGKIQLEMPASIDDCFEGLVEGAYDAVVLNEFTGREKINSLELTGQVDVAAGLPIAIDGLHIIAHKSHPDAVELMAMVNEGLAEIKENGEYQRVIDEHMTRIWASF
ncbi:MAG: transporter substrate-binding domain-containing protein [Pseudomonadota bacterium]